jgi:hypothetical protein
MKIKVKRCGITSNSPKALWHYQQLSKSAVALPATLQKRCGINSNSPKALWH